MGTVALLALTSPSCGDLPEAVATLARCGPIMVTRHSDNVAATRCSAHFPGLWNYSR